MLFCLPLRDKSYEESFASLESLRLDIPVNPSQAGQSPDGDNYCQLPSLRSLHIHFHTNIPWQVVLPLIPWHQLTKLALDHMQVSTVIEIMRECKALVECSLSETRQSNEDFIPPPTSLPHLRNLRLTSMLPISDLIEVLSTFKVPNLKSISIIFTGYRRQDRTRNSPGTDLLSQLDEPLQQLQEFTLIDCFNIVNVRMILSRMPSLRRLNLCQCVSLNDDTAKQISTGQLGPRIETLSFPYCRPVRRVLDMIDKRQENAKSDGNLAPFIHVRLGCPIDSGDKYEEIVEHLEHQHNVQIQMDPFLPVFGDGEEH